MKEVNYLFIKEIQSFIIERFIFVNPDIALFIACQSALESSYCRSTIAIENHNIMGMKKPSIRLSTCIGVNRGHAVFPNKHSCVCDFFYWLQYHGFTQKHLSGDLEQYVRKFRPLGYCPSSDYVNKIYSIYQSFKNYQNEHSN